VIYSEQQGDGMKDDPPGRAKSLRKGDVRFRAFPELVNLDQKDNQKNRDEDAGQLTHHKEEVTALS